MKRVAVLLGAVAITLAACFPSADSPLDPSFKLDPYPGGIVRVTTNADGGPGSFRAAVATANGDASIRKIMFDPALPIIALQQPVGYTGSQELTIQGHRNVVDGGSLAAGEAALDLSGGGDITIRQRARRNQV